MGEQYRKQRIKERERERERDFLSTLSSKLKKSLFFAKKVIIKRGIEFYAKKCVIRNKRHVADKT